MRGEKDSMYTAAAYDEGSPPLARGKASGTMQSTHGPRITPACAGKRPTRLPRPAPTGDHPRLRGEKKQHRDNASCFRGSPPLARGKGNYVIGYDGTIGITPACAGKSCLPSISSIDNKDHPRLRGEKMKCAQYNTNHLGSPPLARGKDGGSPGNK